MEEKMQAALKLPIEQQPIDQLLEVYNTLATLPNLSQLDQAVIAIRRSQLNRNAKLAEAIKALAAAKQNVSAVPNVPLAGDEPLTPRPISYDVTGQLQASSVYDGVKLPALLRVTEPASNRTIVYVRPSRKFDAPKALGRLVGIVGKSHFDSSLNLRIIDVDRLDILEAVEPARPSEAGTSASAEKPTP
jgi:hypothetical protein